MKRVVFQLRMANGETMIIGHLKWPHHVKDARIEGDIAIVSDAKGEATFSLDDVSLYDLWGGEK